MAGRPPIALRSPPRTSGSLRTRSHAISLRPSRRTGRAVRLARYARAVAKQLDTEEEDTLVAGKAVFPNPEAFANA